jgi:Tol biopolymer transport system component/tetratricopeptide (TPR) repeat protein
MDFHEVENRFQELKNQLDAGTIDEEDFEAELRKLYVTDGEGRYWMMGAQTGQWYYYDGAQWIQAQRPEEAVPVPTQAPSPKPPPASSPTRPTAAAPAPPTKRRTSLAVPIVIVLVGLCCVLGAGSVVVEFILADRPISSFVGSLLGRTRVTPGPVSTFGPSATMGLSAADYIRTGDRFFADGRYEEAIAQYQMAISVAPQNAEAYARLGEAHVQLGNCDQAVPEFQQALALDPNLESAQAGLMECGGALPPDVSFASYSRSDLNFSLLYPGTWFVREEELQTIFAEQEEDIDFLRGNIFFISSLPLAPEEEGMDAMGALIKARELINLPMGSQLGGVETISLAGREWATVEGEITGLQTPTTIHIGATVKDSNWYGIWAIGPTDTWEQTSWPIFRTMASTVELEAVVAVASPTMEGSPVAETPPATAEASPHATATATSPGPAPTSPPGASPSPTTPPPTATTRPSTLAGKIAFPRYVGGQNHYELHIADINGTDLNVIYAASEPALDLAGNRIAYRSWDTELRGLVTSNVGGGNRQRPRGGAEPNEDSVPRWSADGLSLVYATKRFGPHRVSHVLTHVLASHAEQDLGDADNPDWSSNGQQIVARTATLIIMDSGGGNRRQLTTNPTDSSPDWAPTGNKIAFMRQTGVNWDIWVINSDGSGETKLTSDGSTDGLPAWSPDGTSIAFLSNRGGAWAIWVMSADGSNQRKLFNTGSSTYATGETFDGEWAGRDPHQPRNWVDEQISWSR